MWHNIQYCGTYVQHTVLLYNIQYCCTTYMYIQYCCTTYSTVVYTYGTVIQHTVLLYTCAWYNLPTCSITMHLHVLHTHHSCWSQDKCVWSANWTQGAWTGIRCHWTDITTISNRIELPSTLITTAVVGGSVWGPSPTWSLYVISG